MLVKAGAIAFSGVVVVALLVVVVAAGGAQVPPAQASGITALSPGAALDAASLPNQGWVPWILQAGSLCPTISAPIVAAQIQTESDWDPHAVSPTGAEGLSQFEPTSWASWGRDDAGDGEVSPFDPPDAILAQGRLDCALVSEMTALAASSHISVLTLALDAYNEGPAAILADDGVADNPQTQAYAPSIEGLAATYASISTSGSQSATPFDAAEVAAAEAQIGVPYAWGGGAPTGPTMGGLDCSGLVLYATFQASQGSITLPHLSEAQVTLGSPVTSGSGAQVLASGLLVPGDVIGFFDLDGDNAWDHVGIYIGNDEMVDAPQTGADVRIDSLDSEYWEAARWTVRSYG